MHRPQFFIWITHTAEATTLLEATRLQKLYTYMCNIVTEFYLYSIVYIYLINSRLDVTFSVRHHFRTIQTLSALTVQTCSVRTEAPLEHFFQAMILIEIHDKVKYLCLCLCFRLWHTEEDFGSAEEFWQ